MSNSLCHYGVLARVPSAPLTNITNCEEDDELLLALSTRHLHVFERAFANPNCSCHHERMDDGTTRTEWFQCPHLRSYEDYTRIASIPIDNIAQVLMTYRTTPLLSTTTSSSVSSPSSASSYEGSGVATRTKDLLLKFTNNTLLWLDFEHNLVRGGFVEALTTTAHALTKPVLIDVDYINLCEHTHLSSTVDLPSSYPPTSFSQESVLSSSPHSQQTASFNFTRDALRNAFYDQIQLALQIACEASSSVVSCSDSHCQALLGAAMELSRSLDEPDLNALVWLANSFINFQTKTEPATLDLSLTQVSHSINVARENSLAYLLSLALHCAADIVIEKENNYALAVDYLVEAIKLMPETIDLSMKMQVHRKIRDLRQLDSTTALSQPIIPAALHSPTKRRSAKKSTYAFNLWEHCGLLYGRKDPQWRQSMTNESKTGTPKNLLLTKVPKEYPTDPIMNTGLSLHVDILNLGGTKMARLRVFFAANATISWLRDEIKQRWTVIVPSLQDEQYLEIEIDAFYDPQNQVMLALDHPLLEYLKKSKQICLHARVSPTAFTKPTTTSCPTNVGNRLVDDAEGVSTAPMLTCSLCQKRVLLDDVETHAEFCS